VRKNGHRGRRVSGTVPATRVSAVRGVWQADFFGPDGELVLVAVDRRRRLVVDPVIVAHGASRIDAAERLLVILEKADPMPALRII
jgi:hypothetical protein